MLDRPLNVVEQGNLLSIIQRENSRIRLQLALLMEHLGLPPVAEEDVDALLSCESSPLDGRRGRSGFELQFGSP